MGGGGAMRAAAKVAGIGVANTAIRGGLSAVAPPSAEQSVRSASRPVSAIISQSGKGGVEMSATVQRPAWELDEWEFAGGEEEMLLYSQEPPPRVVFGGPPSLEEAKAATTELKDALEKVCQPSPTSGGLVEVTKTDSLETKSCITCEPKAPVESIYAVKAFKLLNESPAAQTVVASIAADPNVWNSVLQNDALKEFLCSQKTSTEFQDLKSPMKVTELSDTASQCSFSESSDDSSQAAKFETKQHSDMFEQIKVTVVEMVSNVSGFVQKIFGFSSAEKAPADDDGNARSTFVETVGASFMALALMVIMVVVLKRV